MCGRSRAMGVPEAPPQSRAYAHFADRIHALHSLADKHVNLPQLLNFFLGRVPLVRHSLSSVS